VKPFHEPMLVVAGEDRHRRTAALKRLLQEAEAVLLREPAHHGFDWTILSSGPLRERLERALAEGLDAGIRAFSIPFQKARTEERFYFEQWALDEPPGWVKEVERSKPMG
jgi:ribosome modulation factor